MAHCRTCDRTVRRWLWLLLVKAVQPKKRGASQRKKEEREKRPVDREHGDKNRRTDKNSINFWDSAFPWRKEFSVPVLYFGHACLAQSFVMTSIRHRQDYKMIPPYLSN